MRQKFEGHKCPATRKIRNLSTRTMVCETRKRKLNANNIAKFDEMKEILSEFDNFYSDLQISTLSPILERLGVFCKSK